MLADRIPAIQQALTEANLDGWLFMCFQQNDPVSQSFLGLAGLVSRRCYYLVPRTGEPHKLCHGIEPAMLDHLPGKKQLYSRWSEHAAGLKSLVAGSKRLAVQYSPNNELPGVSRLDAGTAEFLVAGREFFFLEVNTRLQVEHPVTEMITGLDLVREQIRVAAGLELGFSQKDITFEGCSMECRINAENPRTFAPSPGRITGYHAPGGRRVRVDSGLYAGFRIPPHYDSLIAKLIVQGSTREECVMRMRRALHEYVIDGIETTIPLHFAVLNEPDIINGNYDIRWLENFVAKLGGK